VILGRDDGGWEQLIVVLHDELPDEFSWQSGSKKKVGLVERIKKQIDKFGLTNKDLEISNCLIC
jgi:hypothetical protein